jgi:hypothetical protein
MQVLLLSFVSTGGVVQIQARVLLLSFVVSILFSSFVSTGNRRRRRRTCPSQESYYQPLMR